MVNVDIPGGVIIIAGLPDRDINVGVLSLSLTVSITSDRMSSATSSGAICSFKKIRGTPESQRVIISRRTVISTDLILLD